MGVYLYTIRAKSHLVEINGEVVRAHELKFLFNGGSCFEPSRLQRAQWAACEKYWEKRELPKYVVGVYKNIDIGDAVYRWTGKTPYWVDTDERPGEQVGELIEKIYGRWQIRANQEVSGTPN